jgi:hypothetical protein
MSDDGKPNNNNNNNNNKERGLGDTLAFSHHITRII